MLYKQLKSLRKNLTVITSINVKKAINFTETKETLRLVSPWAQQRLKAQV